MYIWEQTDWPGLKIDLAEVSSMLAAVRHEQGRLLGQMQALGFKMQEEAHLQILTQDVVKTSEIEGEHLNASSVRSSIARRLGIDIGALAPTDRNVEGIVEVMLDATGNFNVPLTEDRLFGWHAALFPTGRSGMSKIRVGEWRDDKGGPMQVLSGPYGHERVHYVAPPAQCIPVEVKAFLTWFNAPPEMDPVLNAAMAHLWFVTIHPFDDGNGRIARAIADQALARSEKTSRRFYSMSAQIEAERAAYYDVLERTQKGGMDVSAWSIWFLGCFHRAIDRAHETLSLVIVKAHFWDRVASMPLNKRKIKVLNRLLDGFEGKLTSSKYAKLGNCSQDTASRDIASLLEMGLLLKGSAGGRSTHYLIGCALP